MDRIFGSHYLPSKRWLLSHGLLDGWDGELEVGLVD
jgi:hypothetical protein